MRILIWIDKLSNHLQIDIVNITPSQEGSPLRPLNDSEEVVHDLVIILQDNISITKVNDKHELVLQITESEIYVKTIL